MAKKKSGESLNLYYLNKETKETKGPKKEKKKTVKEPKKKKQNRKEKNEEETINLDNEIVIGLTKMPEPPKTKKTKRKTKRKEKTKEDKKQTKNKRGAGQNPAQEEKEELFDFDKEIVIGLKEVKPETQQAINKKKQKQQERNKQQKAKQQTKEKKVANSKQTKKNHEKGQANSRRSKEQEKRRRRNRILVFCIKWTFLIICLIGAILFFLMTPLFDIAQLQVQGNEKLTQDEIVSLSGITIGQNTYRINKQKVQENIKQNPYVENVTLKRKLPNKMEITIKERKVTFMLPYVNSYVYLNNQGYLLEVSEEKKEVPIITGYTTPETDLVPGNRLNNDDLERLGTVLKIMEAATNNDLKELITEINIQDKTNFKLVLESESKTVELGDSSQLSTKMLWIKKILEKEKDKPGIIFLNGDLKEKVVFREQV